MLVPSLDEVLYASYYQKQLWVLSECGMVNMQLDSLVHSLGCLFQFSVLLMGSAYLWWRVAEAYSVLSITFCRVCLGRHIQRFQRHFLYCSRFELHFSACTIVSANALLSIFLSGSGKNVT